MVENIEYFGPELKIEGFRDALDREVLQDREVHVHKMWTVDAVPKDISRSQIGAVRLAGRRRCCAREWTARVGE